MNRKVLAAKLSRDVRAERVSVSAAVVLLYMADHPESTLREAAQACCVPYVCIADELEG